MATRQTAAEFRGTLSESFTLAIAERPEVAEALRYVSLHCRGTPSLAHIATLVRMAHNSGVDSVLREFGEDALTEKELTLTED